jgi:hypothetical protein
MANGRDDEQGDSLSSEGWAQDPFGARDTGRDDDVASGESLDEGSIGGDVAASDARPPWLVRVERAGPDEQIELAREVLADAPEGFDGDGALELMEHVLGSLRRHGRGDEADDLLDELADAHPDIYREGEHWFEIHRVLDAHARGDEAWRDAFAAVARDPVPVLSDFEGLVRRLMFHGHTRAVADALESAWRDADVGAAALLETLDELRAIAARAIAFRDLASDSPSRDELAATLSIFEGLEVEDFLSQLAILLGEEEVSVDLEQIAPDLPGRSVRRDALLDAFAGALIRERGVAPLRAELVRLSLARFFDSRRARVRSGDLHESPFSARANPRDDSYTRQLDDARHFVMPDADGVERFVREQIAQPYRAVALLEGLGPWIDYLTARDLVERQEARAALERIHEYLAPHLDSLDEHIDDPDLAGALSAALEGSST